MSIQIYSHREIIFLEVQRYLCYHWLTFYSQTHMENNNKKRNQFYCYFVTNAIEENLIMLLEYDDVEANCFYNSFIFIHIQKWMETLFAAKWQIREHACM